MHIQLGQITLHTVQHNFSKYVLFRCYSQLNVALLHNARNCMTGIGRIWLRRGIAELLLSLTSVYRIRGKPNVAECSLP